MAARPLHRDTLKIHQNRRASRRQSPAFQLKFHFMTDTRLSYISYTGNFKRTSLSYPFDGKRTKPSPRPSSPKPSTHIVDSFLLSRCFGAFSLANMKLSYFDLLLARKDCGPRAPHKQRSISPAWGFLRQKVQQVGLCRK
jgi:hypothetical protein